MASTPARWSGENSGLLKSGSGAGGGGAGGIGSTAGVPSSAAAAVTRGGTAAFLAGSRLAVHQPVRQHLDQALPRRRQTFWRIADQADAGTHPLGAEVL